VIDHLLACLLIFAGGVFIGIGIAAMAVASDREYSEVQDGPGRTR